MISIDDPIVLNAGEGTTLRQLAAAGRITVWHSRSYKPLRADNRQGWFADLDSDPKRTWEISEPTYRQLKALGVPETLLPD